MSREYEDFYARDPEDMRESFKDGDFIKAEEIYRPGIRVFFEQEREVGTIEELVPTADGPCIRAYGRGLIPVEDMRLATEEEIEAWDNQV